MRAAKLKNLKMINLNVIFIKQLNRILTKPKGLTLFLDQTTRDRLSPFATTQTPRANDRVYPYFTSHCSLDSLWKFWGHSGNEKKNNTPRSNKHGVTR